ncbi:DUF4870 domain-containing protein [Tamlana sp. 2_MG-2023]|uniref:DUF4870 domain-containing protein n=1 Tax=unclassified Tamlana TaxID=2614803 RepID=UPI0026E40E66|nr:MULTISPECIES: DUF4870 domain-containing protein [unclassified Tamlana]MDO6760351.1 DUF4870 domain-containing protein [Tamlana sp. 2_MG-2023]MDO6789951.1 DUF4870 domain-containing protein [Tamlana sp. 1_MG-2023]
MLDNHQKNIATFIHLSTFSRFIIPFGNFIGPVILWLANKEKSEFIDKNGKQVINFQISILLYVIIIACITIPFFLLNIFSGLAVNNFDAFNFSLNQPAVIIFSAFGLGAIAIVGFILELVLIIIASLKARDGKIYHYPLTIQFLK